MNGINLYFTISLYSEYPFSPCSSTCSSLLILFTMITGYTRKIKNENSEPSTNGIDKNNKMVELNLAFYVINQDFLSLK